MFSFRYNRLIEVKEKLLENKQRELEVALAEADKIVLEIQKMEQDILSNYNKMVVRCLTGKEFTVLKDYLSYLDTRKIALTGEKEKRDNQAQALRMELCSLAIELKMLEKLKARAVMSDKKIQNRKDQKLMDELALRTGAPH